MFRSLAFRGIWASVGVLCGTAGYFLVRPVFQSPPGPPSPWGLWLSTNAARNDRHAGWLANITISEPHDCASPSTVLIDFQGGDSGAHAETSNFSAVADIAFGASEIRVLDAEVPNTGQYVNFDTPRSWRRIQVTNYRGIYVAIAPVRFQGGATLLRLHVDAAASDGPGACYLTSPALFEYPGANNQLWDSAESNAEVYIDKDTNRFRVDYAPLDDAIVTMFVHDEVPDRSVLDAGGLVSGHSTQVTCTGLIPAQEQGDPFSIERELAAQSNCASVQTFRATNAATSLNLRVFVAGILISAAVAMLLEALATGGTEDRRSVPGAK